MINKEVTIHIPELGISEKKCLIYSDWWDKSKSSPFKLEEVTIKSGDKQLITGEWKPKIVRFKSSTKFIEIDEFIDTYCEHCENVSPEYRYVSGVYVETSLTGNILKLSGYRGVKITGDWYHEKHILSCEFSTVTSISRMYYGSAI